MSRYHRITQAIRGALRTYGSVPSDRLESAAKDYSDACASANRRLELCARFLSQGLRSEAVHLAEVEPNLIVLTAGLSFPERVRWLELVEAQKLARPQPLDI